ncbi:MAG: hypothetical protein JSV97_05115 [candidate division WOR-3 bacterium]|nr:MAG: hypothetical protein JSV97_05115 [candidate division WOR-3 bacterium]
MKKVIVVICSCIFAVMSVAWANETRMATLMAGDYIDDIVNIAVYPHHIVMYQNNLYGDITSELEDYGIVIAPDIKYGAVAFWQKGVSSGGFNLGYAIKFRKFDIGILFSPVENHLQYGFGIGRTFFNRHFDLSFIVNDATNDEWYQFNFSGRQRRGDYVIMPKYALNHIRAPFEYTRHNFGLMLQRLILNEGFVYFIAEYELQRGDISTDYTNFYAGLELPLTRIVVLRLGVHEQFIDGFERSDTRIEPGIGLRIREFNLDFHLNQDRLFDKEVTFFNSFGLDLNFGKF